MKKNNNWQIFLLAWVFIIIFGAVLVRLFFIQTLKHDFYSALAEGQHQIYQKLIPKRGEVFLQDTSLKEGSSLYPAAVNKEWPMIYLVPKDIPEEKKDELAQALSLILKIDTEPIKELLAKKDDPYEPLKHKLNDEEAREIDKLNFSGVKLISETLRFYPGKDLASHVLGFLGFRGDDRVGQYGIEETQDEALRGRQGFIRAERGIGGYLIPTDNYQIVSAEDGNTLILSLDYNIQFFVQEKLKKAAERLEIESGTIMVMEPSTGAIRALANFPAFDLNSYSEVEDINVFLNPAVQSVYEPGSVFKPITMAAALDTGKVAPTTTYLDKGAIRIGGYTISNVDGKVYDWQTMIQVLEKSLNTGAVFVQKKIGNDIFKEYLERFGFGQKTGVDLIGEREGDISNLNFDREINFATASFGQGIAVTPLQLISAISAIANGGRLMRPYILEKIIHPDGKETETKPEKIREPITSTTASRLTAMLVSVVENGFGKPARIDGYYVAGKTGTAQIPDSEKGGYSEDTIHTFVGYAPAFNPKFVILVKLDKPQGIRFAADSVSPMFKEMAEFLLNYYEIPPDSN